jgi:UDP-N-acetylglucosamine enolpyruvyl transferase
MTKPIDSLKTIARYIEAKKPKTLDEAEHMLDLISVIADETIVEASVDGGHTHRRSAEQRVPRIG